MAALADSGILVEAASFTELGGWKLDTQHYQQMGGCYLLAHGMGKPVANSATSVTIPYGPKTQPRGRSFLERDLQDSPKQWITPVPRHFETVESPS
jgi:hypothetical protein